MRINKIKTGGNYMKFKRKLSAILAVLMLLSNMPYCASAVETKSEVNNVNATVSETQDTPEGETSDTPSIEKNNTEKPYDYFAAPSPLTKRLKAGHGGAKLSLDEWKTLILWMDFNVPEWNIGGGYSWNRPELRETDPEGEKRLRAAIREKLGNEIAAQPFEALVNRGDETKSRILWLVSPEDRDRFLALVRGALVNSKWHDIDGTCGRPVEDGCECNSCWVRRGNFNRPKPTR